MSSGWYKRQRSIAERPWFTDAQVLQLYDYLEAKAYVVDGMYEGQLIRRGSCPTTRPEMMEVTGQSYKQIDRSLRMLISYGEIIVRGNNRFSVVTMCNYGISEQQLYLFGTAEGTAGGTTKDMAEGTAHLLTIEERINNNLITPYSPYKNERENENVGLEAKNIYNKVFSGKLPPCIRLTLPTKIKVEECIRRFGRQSMDMVFEQVMQEPFSLGQNKTGFQANFQFIFDPKNYQQYLERAQLRKKKQEQPAERATPSKGDIGAYEIQPQREDRKSYEENMRAYAKEHPDSSAARIVAQWDNEQSNNLIQEAL